MPVQAEPCCGGDESVLAHRRGQHTGDVEPRFFATPQEFRAWFEAHHADAGELLVGFHKKNSGRPSITWPESVDEALCFGWIDGIRRRIDDESYSIRFTPRRARSIWSAVNIARAGELIAEGRMTPAGLAAFEARDEQRSAIYSYEQRHRATLSPSRRRGCAPIRPCGRGSRAGRRRGGAPRSTGSRAPRSPRRRSAGWRG
jgi:hypothetical protein